MFTRARFTHLRLTHLTPFARFASTLGASILGASFLVACGGATRSSDATGTTAAELDADNGGMTTTDEPPFFGDPTLEAIPTLASVDVDATDMTTEVAQQGGGTRYAIALLWGHLPAAADASAADTDPTAADWTGTVSVDDGAIAVKKTLQFDARDHVLPRTDAKQVDFVSHTLPFVDGLYLHVAIPAGASTVLHVKTASLSEDIDLATLAGKPGAVDRIPQSSNGLGYIGYREVEGCARGLLFGRWVKTQPALGRFRGHVVDDEGEAIGHVRGIWGHAPRRDADLFFGKYIDTNGAFAGLLGGTYADGGFKGIWGTRDPKALGVLEGFYSDGYDEADGRGVFLGRWTARCN